MGILQKFRKSMGAISKDTQTKLEQQCEQLREQLTPIFNELEEIDLTGKEYHQLEEAVQKKESWEEILESVKTMERRVYKTFNYTALKKEREELERVCKQLEELFRDNNQKYSRRQAMAYSAKLLPVEGHRLDFEQLCVIVNPAKNHLLVGGAGTGKTSIIIGLVKYLIHFQNYSPKEILLLSYTKDYVKEMQRRILKECKAIPRIETFQKLGLEVIAEVEGKKPNTSIKGLLEEVVRETFQQVLQKEWYQRILLFYQLYAKIPTKSWTQLGKEEEIQQNSFTTFLGESVQNHAQVLIANFLFQFGVTYQYRESYQTNINFKRVGEYCPDFYLPEYGIYIEYFELNHNKKSSEEIKWKQKLHKRYKTILIESYGFELEEGILLRQLKKRLKKQGVILKENEELWKIPFDLTEQISLERFFVTIIEQMESCRYTLYEARQQNKQRPLREQVANAFILKLVEPLYEAYHEELRKRNEIDLHEVLWKATDYLKNKKYYHNYQIVIVDEYQDISNSRFELLKALRFQKEFHLFCIGDDWQSIYRFSGSEMNHILNFEKDWGISEIDYLKTSYRLSPNAVKLSSQFILKNQNQKEKELYSGLYQQEAAVERICAENQQKSMQKIPSRLLKLSENSTIFLLGRYITDRDYLFQIPDFECCYNNVTGRLDVIYKKRPDLQITFLTIHEARGLEADYVFVLNNLKIGTGFPVIQQNPSILNLFGSGEDFPDAEERRLFYVAITRAVYQTFFVLEKENESEFIQELSKIREGYNYTTKLKSKGEEKIYAAGNTWKNGN